VCEALLALGAAADALEESCSEVSAPSVSVAPVEPTPASTADDKEPCQAGGSAAFRRLLLEQAEVQATALPPPAAMAEWMALLQQQAAAAGAWPHHPFLAGWQPMPLVHPGMLGALLHQPASVPPLFTSK
jgi:alkanesulfonate monooxygenase SsuD/methylene tetrahydromethanopterin reductase-like flavin-dependent oxidoreductase (luciferase family)